MKYIKLLICILFFQLTYARDECNCQTELEFVINYYEKNLPGFNDNVNDGNRSAYESFKADLFQESLNASNQVQCYRLLTYYVEFFKDNHSNISMALPRIDDTNSEEVNSFLASDLFLSRESYQLETTDQFKAFRIMT